MKRASPRFSSGRDQERGNRPEPDRKEEGRPSRVANPERTLWRSRKDDGQERGAAGVGGVEELLLYAVPIFAGSHTRPGRRRRAWSPFSPAGCTPLQPHERVTDGLPQSQVRSFMEMPEVEKTGDKQHGLETGTKFPSAVHRSSSMRCPRAVWFTRCSLSCCFRT